MNLMIIELCNYFVSLPQQIICIQYAMKTLLPFCLLFCAVSAVCAGTKQPEILTELYQLIDNKSVYEAEKEERIRGFKKMLEVPNLTQEQQYIINRQLINEYRVFIADSAVCYTKLNLEIAEALMNDSWIYESTILLASLYSISGKYLEGLDLLNSINAAHLKQLSDWLLIEYYGTYKELYRYYTSLRKTNEEAYYFKSTLYRDSLLNMVEKNSLFHTVLCAEQFIDENNTEEAKNILLDLFNNYHDENREKAIFCNVLANVYRKEGDIEQQIKFYAISSICDIKNAIKENSSMQALASVLFETGDIDNAYKCIKSSMDDAMFSNAYLRMVELSGIFPIIEVAYQKKLAKQQQKLQLSLQLVSILSLLLVVAVIYVYLQMKRLARIRKDLYHTNLKLKELNENLQQSNQQLHHIHEEVTKVNKELLEANLVKETYLGKFIDLCSNYIDKLDNYRRNLNRIVTSGKIDELHSVLKSTQYIDNELNDFFRNFDQTFLRIYPTFIEDFNALFPEEEKQTPKSGELLNTELRIYALIRLGINDSGKIALFLRYSITTVYTYRSKLKSKSLSKELLEEEVMKIGK